MVNLDINIIRNVLKILREGNPYVQTFNKLGAIPNLDDYVIELNTNVTLDQRRYNLLSITCLCCFCYFINSYITFLRYNVPTVSQVAAIWTNGNDP